MIKLPLDHPPRQALARRLGVFLFVAGVGIVVLAVVYLLGL